MHNYSYDKIGNLVADKSEEIEEISWTMQGKVKRITRLPNSQKPDLVFNYDGLGNRVSKTVIPKNSVNGEDSITTYYIRDVQGNILATYERTKYKNGDEEFYLKEQYLYGSTRIGMNVSNLLLASNINGSVEIKEYDGYFTKTVGNKRFELTNHLGNVLAIVSDKKGVDNEPDVISLTDYYPFGMQMPGRSFNANSYRFSFNGKEDINEINGWQDYGERMYNKLTGRFDSPDPIIVYEQKYPELSSYQFASNTPIWGIDWDGLEVRIYTETQGLGHVFVTIQDYEDVIVYTYGRYLGGDKGKPSLNSTDPSGRGVLIKLTGEEAQRYIKHELNDVKARVFEITDVSEIKVKQHFDNMFNSGRKFTEEEANQYDNNQKKYGTSIDASVIDQYSITNNNCTTKSCEGVIEGGSEVFDYSRIISSSPYNPIGSNTQTGTSKFFVPLMIQDYLENKSKQTNGQVKEVTQ